MLSSSPEWISSTPFGIVLPPGAIVTSRELVWTRSESGDLLVVTGCRFADAPFQSLMHRYDAAGRCGSAHVTSSGMRSLSAGGSRLAFSDVRDRYVIDLADGARLDHREETFGSVLSESGGTVALSGYIYDGGLEIRPVGDSTKRYPPPVPRKSRALWVTDAKDLLYESFDHVALYRYAPDESERVCERLGRGAGGEWHASTDGTTVIYATRTEVRIFSVSERREVAKHGVSAAVAALTVGANGLVAVADYKGRISLLHGDRRRVLSEPPRARKSSPSVAVAKHLPKSLAFSADSKWLAWASEAASSALNVAEV
jgi:hypothetical protein